MKPLVFKKRRRLRHQPKPRIRIAVTKGDMVQVLSGDEAGKRARVLRVHRKTGRVTLEGVNLVKRHRKATQNTEAGIVQFPAPIHHSKVMLLDPKSGEPTRIRRRTDKDGTVERIAVKSGQPIPRNRQ
ncbi:MAG TPA: 50S ribosomal protein L24 [Gemmatimonadales bacterium]|nr:50S ribosomal protein L24 [Gemmatimonadales bacterium]